MDKYSSDPKYTYVVASTSQPMEHVPSFAKGSSLTNVVIMSKSTHNTSQQIMLPQQEFGLFGTWISVLQGSLEITIKDNRETFDYVVAAGETFYCNEQAIEAYVSQPKT